MAFNISNLISNIGDSVKNTIGNASSQSNRLRVRSSAPSIPRESFQQKYTKSYNSFKDQGRQKSINLRNTVNKLAANLDRDKTKAGFQVTSPTSKIGKTIRLYSEGVNERKQYPRFFNQQNTPKQWATRVVADTKKRGLLQGVQDLSNPILMSPYVYPIAEPLVSSARSKLHNLPTNANDLYQKIPLETRKKLIDSISTPEQRIKLSQQQRTPIRKYSLSDALEKASSEESVNNFLSLIRGDDTVIREKLPGAKFAGDFTSSFLGSPIKSAQKTGEVFKERQDLINERTKDLDLKERVVRQPEVDEALMLLRGGWEAAKTGAKINPLANTGRVLFGSGFSAVFGDKEKSLGTRLGEGGMEAAGLAPLLNITDPATGFLINKLGGGFLMNQLMQRTVAGGANVGEDRIINYLDDTPEKVNDSYSFWFAFALAGWDDVVKNIFTKNLEEAKNKGISEESIPLKQKIVKEISKRKKELSSKAEKFAQQISGNIKKAQDAYAKSPYSSEEGFLDIGAMKDGVDRAASRLKQPEIMVTIDGKGTIMSKADASDWTAYLQSKGIDYTTKDVTGKGGFIDVAGKGSKSAVTTAKAETMSKILENSQTVEEARFNLDNIVNDIRARGDENDFQALKRSLKEYKKLITNEKGVPRNPEYDGLLNDIESLEAINIKDFKLNPEKKPDLATEVKKYGSAEEFTNKEISLDKMGSKYVEDNDGLFYRGTKRTGQRNNGFYSSNPLMAEDFLPMSGDGELIIAKVDIKKPYFMDADELEYLNQNPEIINDLKTKGYDGIIEKNTPETEVNGVGDEWQRIAFNENQVKEIARINTDRVGAKNAVKQQLTDIYNQANGVDLNNPQQIKTETNVLSPTGKTGDIIEDTKAVPDFKETYNQQLESFKANQEAQRQAPIEPKKPDPEVEKMVKEVEKRVLGEDAVKEDGETTSTEDFFYNEKRVGGGEETQQVIKNVKKEIQDDVEEITGKPLTFKEIEDLARKTNKKLNKVIGREETARMGAQALKLRNALAAEAQRVAKGDESNITNLLEMMKIDKAYGENLARLLGQRRITSKPEDDVLLNKMLQDIISRGNDFDKVIEKSKGVDFTNKEDATRFYREFVKPKASDWIDKLRYSSMLSSPLTHIKNIVSNLSGAPIASIEKTIAGQFDWLNSKLTGKERTRFAGEGKEFAIGYLSNIKNAFNRVGQIMTDKKFSDAHDLYNIKLSEPSTKLRRLENLMDFPGKALQAADEFFQVALQGGIKRELKFRESKGINVEDIDTQAYNEAKKRLFNTQLGPKEDGYLLDAIDYLPKIIESAKKNKNPVISWPAKLTFPFVKIGTNLIKSGVEYSPLGFATIPGAANKGDQVARAFMGTSFSLMVAAATSTNNLTFAEPIGEKQKQAYRDAGMQPYSIKFGDKWHSYQSMHPAISFPMALVASVQQSIDNKTINQGTADLILNGLSDWMNFYMDQSMMKGLGDGVKALQGDVDAKGRFLANYVNQLIPARALLGWVARIVDPVQRQADKDGSYLTQQLQWTLTQIPLLSGAVPARENQYGEPILRTDLGLNAFSPARITTEDPEKRKIYEDMRKASIETKNIRIEKKQIEQEGKPSLLDNLKETVGVSAAEDGSPTITAPTIQTMGSEEQLIDKLDVPNIETMAAGEGITTKVEEPSWIGKIFGKQPKVTKQYAVGSLVEEKSNDTVDFRAMSNNKILSVPKKQEAFSKKYKGIVKVLENYSSDLDTIQFNDTLTNGEKTLKLRELQDEYSGANETNKILEANYPEMVFEAQLDTYKSGGGMDTKERGTWAYEKLASLVNSGKEKKSSEWNSMVNRMWEEKVLTTGSEGSLQYIIDNSELTESDFKYTGDDKSIKKSASGGGTGSTKKFKSNIKPYQVPELLTTSFELPSIDFGKYANLSGNIPIRASSYKPPQQDVLKIKQPNIKPLEFQGTRLRKIAGL